MAFTRIFSFAKCTASHSVKFVTAAFAAEYAGILVSGRYAFIEEILSTEQPFLPIISAINTWLGKSTPLILRSNTKSKPFSSMLKNVKKSLACSSPFSYSSCAVVHFGLFPPAPFISISHFPRSLSTLPCTSSIFALSSTLHL